MYYSLYSHSTFQANMFAVASNILKTQAALKLNKQLTFSFQLQ